MSEKVSLMAAMDTDKRTRELLSSQPVVPDYAAKWCPLGRLMKHQMMRSELATTTKSSTIMDVGQPNQTLSPVTGIKFQLSCGEEIEVEKQLLGKLGVYGMAEGLPELKHFLMDVQRAEHKPPQMVMDNHPSKFNLLVTTGITEALQSCMKAMMDEEDTILMEDISYISFIINLRTHGMRVQGVPFDDKGIVPEALEDTLKNWSTRHPGRRFPKILYTVALASNPRGHNWCLGRMLDVYLICRKYDVIIMDDGAYYFLQFGQRARSFQSFDIDGRVIRFDTFSKILGAGYRIGWVSGPKAIMDKIEINHELTCVHASALTQIYVYSLLKKWGLDGFEKRVRTVANFYKKQSECLMSACDRYLTGLATWTVPKGGMFIWISIQGVPDSSAIVSELRQDYDVRLIPGKFFHTDSHANSGSIRVCFSSASEEAMTKGIKCLGDVIRKKIAQGTLRNGTAQ